MIEHTPGEWVAQAIIGGYIVKPPSRITVSQLAGNVELLHRVSDAPHECSDPHCPGNENRRRLEAFDGLLEIANSALLHWTVMATDSSFSVAERQGAREKAEAAREIIAKAQE